MGKSPSRAGQQAIAPAARRLYREAREAEPNMVSNGSFPPELR